MDKRTNIDVDLFARVMALPTSLRHDVLKFIGATHSQQDAAKDTNDLSPVLGPSAREN